MTALFGPQTSKSQTVKPDDTTQRFGNQQTWFQNCSGPGASDGTVPDAAFYNRIIGALDYICGITSVSALPGDDSALYRAIMEMIQGDAPQALNTLKELADALGDDPNFATTVLNAVAGCVQFNSPQTLSSIQKAQFATNVGLAAVAFSGQWADIAGKPGFFSGAYSDLTGKPTLGTAAALNVGTAANQVVQLTAADKLPAVDGSLLTNIPYASLTGKPTLGTAAALNVGTAAGNVVELDPTTGKLPAVDGSLLTNLSVPAGALPSFSGVLSSDQPMGSLSVWVAGPQVSLPAGTYLVMSTLIVSDTSAGSGIIFRILNGTNGSTVYASSKGYIPLANGVVQSSLISIVTLSSAAVLVAEAMNAATATGTLRFNSSGQGQDSKIIAVKIA